MAACQSVLVLRDVEPPGLKNQCCRVPICVPHAGAFDGTIACGPSYPYHNLRMVSFACWPFLLSHDNQRGGRWWGIVGFFAAVLSTFGATWIDRRLLSFSMLAFLLHGTAASAGLFIVIQSEYK